MASSASCACAGSASAEAMKTSLNLSTFPFPLSLGMEESYVSDPALPLSLSISFPSNVSLGDAAIWLFIAAWAELLDVSFGIWSWFYDFSIIPLHFLYVSFASLELLLHQ